MKTDKMARTSTAKFWAIRLLHGALELTDPGSRWQNLSILKAVSNIPQNSGAKLRDVMAQVQHLVINRAQKVNQMSGGRSITM